jgi:hypothetical protein
MVNGTFVGDAEQGDNYWSIASWTRSLWLKYWRNYCRCKTDFLSKFWKILISRVATTFSLQRSNLLCWPVRF